MSTKDNVHILFIKRFYNEAFYFIFVSILLVPTFTYHHHDHRNLILITINSCITTTSAFVAYILAQQHQITTASLQPILMVVRKQCQFISSISFSQM